MKALPLAATLLAAAVLLGSRPGAAADLDYGYVPPPDRYGSAYDDPRYRDLYAPEPPRAYRFEPRSYADVPPPGPIPPGRVYPDRFADWGPSPDWRFADGCLPRREVRHRLHQAGWHNFHDIEIGRSWARVTASRPNGDVFRLKVDRCNGEVLRADVIDRHDPGPYAWRHGPRSGRPYY
ncbi:MAG: hypothetical protein AB7L90_14860 [Hyphomicrobiaceae bacterium]